jgi:hypothetical protein
LLSVSSSSAEAAGGLGADEPPPQPVKINSINTAKTEMHLLNMICSLLPPVFPAAQTFCK